jgi:hypothetical protein
VKTVVLSSYPLLDRFAYKERVVRGLVGRGFEVLLVYGGTDIRDYAREARRRRPLLELQGRLRARRTAPRPMPADPRAEKLCDVARGLGVPVLSFRRLNDPECLRALSAFAPDLVHNLSALYVPDAVLDASGYRVVGGHYADLPRLRGIDTVRWTILIDHPLVVSHQLLSPEFDMGDVVLRTPVAIRRGDGIDSVRRGCQAAAAAGHLVVAEQVADGRLERTPQRPEDGTTFFQMGAYLRARVDELLRDCRYSHYTLDRAAA